MHGAVSVPEFGGWLPSRVPDRVLPRVRADVRARRDGGPRPRVRRGPQQHHSRSIVEIRGTQLTDGTKNEEMEA